MRGKANFLSYPQSQHLCWLFSSKQSSRFKAIDEAKRFTLVRTEIRGIAIDIV